MITKSFVYAAAAAILLTAGSASAVTYSANQGDRFDGSDVPLDRSNIAAVHDGAELPQDQHRADDYERAAHYQVQQRAGEEDIGHHRQHQHDHAHHQEIAEEAEIPLARPRYGCQTEESCGGAARGQQHELPAVAQTQRDLQQRSQQQPQEQETEDGQPIAEE